MGIGQSRRTSRATQTASGNGNSYKYPPKTDNYFSTHFIMGGERFENAKPDAYLFGENEDLNFLGAKPTPFPYPVPQPHEPTKTLKSLVNIRRDSVRFIKEIDETGSSSSHDVLHTRYNIEFTFDTDVKCAITIYYFAKEELNNKQAIYRPRDPAMNSDTFHYKRGANQTFSQPTHFIDPSQFDEEDWKYDPGTEVIPIVIHCVVEEAEFLGHSHMTFATVERSSLDGGFSLKALKQKQMVDGLCYLLQEIYGIENKNAQRARQMQDEDIEDNGSECVICMCEMRDTLILPCRHLCLCNSCADNLRYQANNCPICRAKFHALLQIRTMRKRTTPSPTTPNELPDEGAVSQDGIPARYEAISLIEALNGPTQPHCACSVPIVPADGTTVQPLTNTAVATDVPVSETALELDIKDNKEIARDEAVSSQNEEVTSGDVDRQSVKGTEDSVPIPLCPPTQEERECYEMSIPISDDEDNDTQTDSSYATPLHQTRVAPISPVPPQNRTTSDSPEPGNGNGAGYTQTSDETRLQIIAGGSSGDSQYSSSSSTRDLLENNPEEALENPEIRGILGCPDDFNVSEV